MSAQTEIDNQLASLIQASPSLNALARTDREAVILNIFLLPEDQKFEVRDTFLKEQKDLAEASAKDMHEHYMKLKSIYGTLKGMKSRLERKVQVRAEASERKDEGAVLEELEQKLDDFTT